MAQPPAELPRITEADLAVPFPMKCAVDERTRQSQMAVCLRYCFPRLQLPSFIDDFASCSIACYGPSLADTYMRMTRPIISMSGSHDFLISRGIVPDYHVDMDPRPHKVQHIIKPHKDVRYLMASVCHPFTWSILKHAHVEVFHVVSGANTYRWLQQHDPGGVLIVAGSSMGLGAMHVGGMLGFRHFEVHGMDGSYRGKYRHAGAHYGHKQKPIPIRAGGKEWNTSKIMHNSNIELFNMLNLWPFFVVLHGDGLLQAMMRDLNPPNGACASDPVKAEMIRTARVELVVERIECPVTPQPPDGRGMLSALNAPQRA